MQLVLDLEESLDVVRGEVRHALGHPARIRPPRHDPPVGQRGLHARLAGDHLQAVVGELQVADDLGPEHAGDVGRGRHPAARRALRIDLLGHGAAADDGPALEDERPQSRVREIERRGQAVVACADDDGVVAHRASISPCTTSPPNRVSSTFVSEMSAGSISNRFRSITIRSASLPTSMEPVSSSCRFR